MMIEMREPFRVKELVKVIIYLMSKTWEVFAQSSEPGARVKNARQQLNKI